MRVCDVCHREHQGALPRCAFCRPLANKLEAVRQGHMDKWGKDIVPRQSRRARRAAGKGGWRCLLPD